MASAGRFQQLAVLQAGGNHRMGAPGHHLGFITANLFHTSNTLAIEAIESGQERMTVAAVERWEPEFDGEAAFA